MEGTTERPAVDPKRGFRMGRSDKPFVQQMVEELGPMVEALQKSSSMTNGGLLNFGSVLCGSLSQIQALVWSEPAATAFVVMTYTEGLSVLRARVESLVGVEEAEDMEDEGEGKAEACHAARPAIVISKAAADNITAGLEGLLGKSLVDLVVLMVEGREAKDPKLAAAEMAFFRRLLNNDKGMTSEDFSFAFGTPGDFWVLLLRRLDSETAELVELFQSLGVSDAVPSLGYHLSRMLGGEYIVVVKDYDCLCGGGQSFERLASLNLAHLPGSLLALLEHMDEKRPLSNLLLEYFQPGQENCPGCGKACDYRRSIGLPRQDVIRLDIPVGNICTVDCLEFDFSKFIRETGIPDVHVYEVTAAVLGLFTDVSCGGDPNCKAVCCVQCPKVDDCTSGDGELPVPRWHSLGDLEEARMKWLNAKLESLRNGAGHFKCVAKRVSGIDEGILAHMLEKVKLCDKPRLHWSSQHRAAGVKAPWRQYDDCHCGFLTTAQASAVMSKYGLTLYLKRKV